MGKEVGFEVEKEGMRKVLKDFRRYFIFTLLTVFLLLSSLQVSADYPCEGGLREEVSQCGGDILGSCGTNNVNCGVKIVGDSEYTVYWGVGCGPITCGTQQAIDSCAAHGHSCATDYMPPSRRVQTDPGSCADCCVWGTAKRTYMCPGDCIDSDGDGFYAISGTCPPGNDCDDNDPDINPGALEIAYNGTDENCEPGDDDDLDGDGFDHNNDCDDTDPAVHADCSPDRKSQGDFGYPGEYSGRPNNDPCQQDPHGSPVWDVNMVNMNLFVTDIPLWSNPPVGPAVKIQLSYNSLAHAAKGGVIRTASNASGSGGGSSGAVTLPPYFYQPFGRKWTFNYSSRIITYDYDAYIIMPDGRVDRFEFNETTQEFENPAGVFNTLTRTGEAPNYGYELKLLDGTVYVYSRPEAVLYSNTGPLLTEIRDAYGRKVVIGYNTIGQVVVIIDALGRYTTFKHNGKGLVEKVDDSYGRSATFEYDTENGKRNLTKVVDMGGYVTEYTYDESTNLTGIINKKPNAEGINDIRGSWYFNIETDDETEDENVRQSHYPAPDGPMWRNYRITATDQKGGKEEYYYDGLSGNSWRVSPKDYVEYKSVGENNYVNPYKTSYYFDRTDPQRVKIRNIQYPEGGYTEFSDFDTVTGKPKRITDFHGPDSATPQQTHTREFTYNMNGLIETYRDAKGKLATYEYDTNQRDLKTIKRGEVGAQTVFPVGVTYERYPNSEALLSKTITDTETKNRMKIEYNDYGQPWKITEESTDTPIIKLTTEFLYVNHLLTDIKKAAEGSPYYTTITYDAKFRVSSYTDPMGVKLSYAYNDLDQLTKIMYPDTGYSGTSPISKYVDIRRSSTCAHIIDSITDRGGLETNYTHDELKRLTRTDGPAGIFEFGYDPNSNLTGIIEFKYPGR